jgi:ATP-dependent DNA helicase RecQ
MTSAPAASGAATAPNAPLVLMTAHRAKGLEFDHVLILDGRLAEPG